MVLAWSMKDVDYDVVEVVAETTVAVVETHQIEVDDDTLEAVYLVEAAAGVPLAEVLGLTL